VTQQNAALVEEASAAARSLEEQAEGLAQSVSQFRLEDSATAASVRTLPRPVSKLAIPAGKPTQRAVVKPVSKSASSVGTKRLAAMDSNGKHNAAVEGSGSQTWTEF
jgi:hypothetical protein